MTQHRRGEGTALCEDDTGRRRLLLLLLCLNEMLCIFVRVFTAIVIVTTVVIVVVAAAVENYVVAVVDCGRGLETLLSARGRDVVLGGRSCGKGGLGTML